MKQFTLLLLFAFAGAAGYGQHFKVSSSAEFKITERLNKNHVISNSMSFRGSLYSIYMNKSTGASKWLFTKVFDIKNAFEIAKYDINMNLVKESKVENGEKNFANINPELIHFNDQLLVGYFKHYKKESFDYYIAAVDTVSLALSEPVKLFSVPVKNVGIMNVSEFVTEIPVQYAVSPDNSHILFTVVSSGKTVNVQVLTRELKTEKKYEVPVSGAGEYSTAKGIITNDGFVLVPLNSKEGDRKLLTIDQAGKKDQLSVNNLVPGKYPYPLDCQLSRDKQSVYLYSALNNNKGDDLYCHGVFVTSYDLRENKLQKPLIYPFSAEFMTALIGKGSVKSANILYVFTFRPQLTELDNGDLVLTGAPEILRSETTQYGNQRPKSWGIFEAGSVISVFINKETGAATPAFLPRRIFLSLPGALSSPFSRVHILGKAGSIAMVYLDYEKNINQPIDKPVYTFNSPDGLVLAEAEIGKDGTIISRKQLGLNQKGNYSYYMNYALTEPGQDFLLIPIGKQGLNFNEYKEFFTYWYKLEPAGK
ncbi:MAG: hypothetical protein HZA79_12635 [Sphingobacteriales bacterium]|nr:hypothetical protein [Sphingobacteriales bacterium]